MVSLENLDKHEYQINQLLNGEIIKDGNIDKTYRNTNEDLTMILKGIDFNGKNVLSVLASSDQEFSAYYLGAENVDSFDRNFLSEYYYYLKKWALLKNNKYYIPANNKDLLECLELAQGDYEVEIAKMWKRIIEKASSLYYSKLFYHANPVYSVPYENDCSKLSEIIHSKCHNFMLMDLFKLVSFEKKYDIIILSNILEYMMDYEDDIVEQIVSENLSNLVSDDGIIILSNILDNDVENSRALKKKFYIKKNKFTKKPYTLELKPLSFILEKKK